MDNTAS